MKNKKLIIGIALGVLILLVGAGLFITKSKSSTTAQEDTTQSEVVQTLQPSDIGLKMALRDDKKAVKITIAKTSDIKHIAFDVSYDADARDAENESTGDKVTRGFSDEVNIDKSKPFESKFYLLGSCSTGGKCVYDTGVETLKIVLNLQKTDGKTYQITDTLTIQ